MAIRPIKISVIADADKARKELAGVGNALKTGLTVAAAAGAAGVVAVLKSSVTAASEAQQSLGATEAIYGKYADTVIKRSNDAADSVGLSANAYRESSNLLGALFKNQGVELDKLSGKTDRHLKLASDLSAMYGGTVTESVDALTAAYKGEFNQLEKYGVTLKQDTINTRANEIAKRKYGKELKNLSPAQAGLAKQLATQKLLFEQTADASGTFAEESNTLAGQQQRLTAELDNVKAEIGTALLPVLTDLAQWARKEVVPALQDFSHWLGENEDEIQKVSREIGAGLLPVLKTAGDVVGDVVGFFVDLPGPVKEVGVQAGIAALVIPRFTAALGLVTARAGLAATAVGTFSQRLAQNRAAMTYASGVYGKTAAALHGFGGAARNVAGVGGMLLLYQGMQKSDGAARTLMTTMGGAALGFSIGGPVGAAVGGLAGLMVGLSDGTNRAEIAAAESLTTWQTYASTLDSVTGATTRATKSMVIQDLQQSGLLGKAKELGISQATLVNGVLGQAKASGVLTSAIKSEEASIRDAVAAYNEKYDTSIAKASDEAKAVFESITARRANLDAIKKEVGEVSKSTKAKREELLVLQNFPDAVITKVQTPGAVDSKRELANLVATYKLTPKQIQTVIKMNGIQASVKDVRGLAQEIKKSGNVKPADAWRGFFKADLGKAKGDARGGLGDINDLLRSGLNAKPNIAKGPFGRGVSGDLSALISVARGKANTVGSNLGSGMYNGMGPWIQPIADRARSMVAGAVAAANAAGGIRSPSRETMKTGRYLGEGLDQGLRRSQPKARTAGQKLVDAVRAGVVKGTPGVESALDRVTSTIENGITGKNQADRERALLTRYAAHYNALKRNAKAQDTNTRRLEQARDKLKDLTAQYKEYARTIRDTVTATGDVTQLGRQDDGTVTIKSLLGELENKVLGAERFAVLVQQLATSGLSRTAVQQLLDAGPEAALATAEAIASGGAASIEQMNQLQERLAKSGTQLGDLMAKRYYGAGVDAAKGVVKGLEAQSKNLDRAALRLANSLVAAVKKALGIRSPSRVFAGIGDNVIKGLDLGIDDTYVKRTGAVAAASLRKGFGTPALDAFASSRADEGAGRKVEITLTAQAVDQLTQGKRIQATLDYARSNGVRGTTF